jgi:hypothetical protein
MMIIGLKFLAPSLRNPLISHHFFDHGSRIFPTEKAAWNVAHSKHDNGMLCHCVIVSQLIPIFILFFGFDNDFLQYRSLFPNNIICCAYLHT